MKKFFLLSFILIVLLINCKDAKKNTIDANQLTIGLMPAVDSAPILLAEKKGYFNELGLKIKIEIYTNAQVRQTALQTETIEGAMTDLIAAATNINSGFKIKATTMTNGMFPVLVNKASLGKKKIKVGVMEVSVSNFLTDEWLSAKYEIEKVFINEIPARLEAVASGQIDMGLFPEPVASAGELKGLKKIIYQMEDKYCPDVIVFTQKAIKEKKDAIKLFHQAYNKAIDDINNNNSEALDILIEKIPNITPEIKDKIILPVYKKALLPDDDYLKKIINWTAKLLNKDLKLAPEDLVDKEFIQK